MKQSIQTFEKAYLPNDNVLIMSIEQAMANQYIRELSVNVKRGNRAKLERGEWPNHAPFRYKNDKSTKLVVIDKDQAFYVREMFNLYATGSHSFKDISDLLFEKGLRTKSGQKVFKGTVQSILSRSFYTGIMERDGKVYNGIHEPIITKKTFDDAQQVMDNTSRPRPHKHFFPVRGYLSCNKCGCALTASIKKGHHYYYCTNCTQHKNYIHENDIYKLVAQSFDSLIFSERKIELMYRSAKEIAESNSTDKSFVINNLKKTLDALNKKESVLLDTLLAEQISKEHYQEKVVEIKKEAIALKRQILVAEKNSDLLTLEPIKKVFQEASKAKSEFLNASDIKKRIIIEKLLWNLIIEDKSVAQIKFKSPHQVLANAPKNASISEMLAVWDDVRTFLHSIHDQT